MYFIRARWGFGPAGRVGFLEKSGCGGPKGDVFYKSPVGLWPGRKIWVFAKFGLRWAKGGCILKEPGGVVA